MSPPRSAAVARYSSTTRKESKLVGSAAPESCTFLIEPITSFSVAGSRRSSASIALHSTNSVTRHGGSSSWATTRGATPSKAAF